MKQGGIYLLIIFLTLFNVTIFAADKASLSRYSNDSYHLQSKVISSQNLVKESIIQRSRSDLGCELTSRINRDGSISMVCIDNTPSTYAYWDIEEWNPRTLAKVGDALTIHGYNMPEIDIKLGNATLDIISASTSSITVRLPDTETNAPLVAVRKSDNQEAILENNYQVNYPFHYFEAENTGFSWVNSYLLSAASMTVYDDSNDFSGNVTERFAKMGLTVDYSDDTNSLGVDLAIAHNDEIVLVTIRGTQMSEDWQDVAIDGFHPLIPAPPSWGLFGVHAGFFIAASSVFDLIADTVSPLLTNDRKLWITGHSLGGAMSSLIAYRLQVVNNINIEGVQTFGSPRVGNYYWTWANGFTGMANKTYRWVAEGDTVTTFPFRDLKDIINPIFTPGNTYSHVGYVNTMFSDGSMQINGPEYFFIQTNPVDMITGLFDEHMSYSPRIYNELANHIDSELHAIMPTP